MSKIKAKNITLGDNVDTTKNIVIKVPTVADGTLSIETEAGVAIGTLSVANGGLNEPAKVSGCMGRLAANSMTAGVWDDVYFNKILWQVGTAFNASTYDFTAPRTGQYHVSSGLYITGTSMSGLCLIEIYVNGAAGGGFSGNVLPTGSTAAYSHISRTLQLTAGDKLTIKAHIAGGSSIASQATDTGTYFSVFEL